MSDPVDGKRIALRGLLSRVFLYPWLRAARTQVSARFDGFDCMPAAGRSDEEDARWFDSVEPAAPFPDAPYRLAAAEPDGGAIGAIDPRWLAGGAALRRLDRIVHARREARRLAGYDLVHAHCLFPDWLLPLQFIPADVPVVCSFWGGDLYEVAGPGPYAMQYAALERADLITVHSPEIAAVARAKFGERFAAKTRRVCFPMNELTWAAIDRLRGESSKGALRETVLAELGLPPGRLFVGLAHSGDAVHQHLPVLAQLARLPEAVKRRLALVLPMGYAGSPEYRAAVVRALAEGGLAGRVIEHFLGPEAMARLHWAADLRLHLPASDFFSLTMLEALHAGNVVLTGDWLPFARLRQWGIPHHTVAALDELPAALAAVLERLPEHAAAVAAAAGRLAAELGPAATVNSWLDVYREAFTRGPARRAGPPVLKELAWLQVE